MHKDKDVDNFFNRQRQSKGISVIPFGKAARQCLNLLRENKMVALVGDRDFSEKMQIRRYELPQGSAYLSHPP